MLYQKTDLRLTKKNEKKKLICMLKPLAFIRKLKKREAWAVKNGDQTGVHLVTYEVSFFPNFPFSYRNCHALLILGLHILKWK